MLQCVARFAREFGRKRLHRGVEGGIFHRAIDEPDSGCSVGVDKIAGEQHLQRMFARDGARQRDCRGGAEQAVVDAGSREAGATRGEREIASRDELAPRGGRDALHLGNHRLWQRHNCLHHARAVAEQFVQEYLSVVAAHFLQIMSGTERTTGTRDHDHAHCRILCDLGKGHIEGCDRVAVQGVITIRAIESEGGDSVGIVTDNRRRRDQGRGGCHGRFPSAQIALSAG